MLSAATLSAAALSAAISPSDPAEQLDSLIAQVDGFFDAYLWHQEANASYNEATKEAAKDAWLSIVRNAADDMRDALVGFVRQVDMVTPELERLGADTSDIFAIRNGLTAPTERPQGYIGPSIESAMAAWHGGSQIRLQRLRAGLISSPFTQKLKALEDARNAAELRLFEMQKRLDLQWQKAEAEKPRSPTTPKKGMSPEEANKKALALVEKMGAPFYALSTRKQAKRIGCSFQTWKKTNLFKERCKREPTKPARTRKAVAFDAQADAATATGGNDGLNKVIADEQPRETVAQLAAEQHVDDDQNPSRKRYNRCHKRA